MSPRSKNFIFIDKPADFTRFYEENKDARWLCFDTEFVGEKRYYTRLCLIQVATQKGNYLIDPFQVKDLGYFLDLLEDPNLLKVTHAGDNDYRLLNDLYGVIPTNIFDTQLAAGLVGYKYPVSFQKLVENELRIHVGKGYTVADWESRPLHKKQLQYAINDVLPLYDLWQKLEEKLRERERLHWARQEFGVWEDEDYYIRDPHREALSSNLIKSLNQREQVFLIRLYAWRRRLAKEKNHSREMVLPKKMIGHIVRGVQAGKDALFHNRRIPNKIVHRYGKTFEELFQAEINEEEKALLKKIYHDDPSNPRKDILLEMIYLLIKYKCLDNAVSPDMVLPKNMLKKIRKDPDILEEVIKNGWRQELLGNTFVSWMENLDRLELDIGADSIELKME